MDRCEICGVPAMYTFGSIAVCENVVCQQAVLDIVNAKLQEAHTSVGNEVEVDIVSLFQLS
jgi:hypothetical protein